MRYSQLPPIGKKMAYSMTNQLRVITDVDENFVPVFRTSTLSHKRNLNLVTESIQLGQDLKPKPYVKPVPIIDPVVAKRFEDGAYIKAKIRSWQISDINKVKCLTVVELFEDNKLSQEDMFKKIDEIISTTFL